MSLLSVVIFMWSGSTEILCKSVLFCGLFGFVDIQWNLIKFCPFSKSNSRGKLCTSSTNYINELVRGVRKFAFREFYIRKIICRCT